MSYHALPTFLKLLVLKKKITVCVIETMLMTLPLVQMNKVHREVNQQTKHKSGKIATVLKTYLNDLKKYLTTFQVVDLCKSNCKSTYYNSLNPCKLQFFVKRVVNLHI